MCVARVANSKASGQLEEPREERNMTDWKGCDSDLKGKLLFGCSWMQLDGGKKADTTDLVKTET